jgi:hypothetical protein
MANYNWNIVSMENYPTYAGQSNVVFSVNWNCIAEQEGKTANSLGTVAVTYVEGEPFTAYADLTEEQVWGWVNPNIDRTGIEADLQAMLNAELNPTTETDTLPWAEVTP